MSVAGGLGGANSIDKKKENFGLEITEKVEQLGWTEEDALTHTCLTGMVGAVIARALDERDSRYAASTYGIVNALQRAAIRQTTTPPPGAINMAFLRLAARLPGFCFLLLLV